MITAGIESTLKKADKYLKNGSYLEAKDLYASALQKYPKNERARRGIQLINQKTSEKPPAENATEPTKNELNTLITFYSRKEFIDGIQFGERLVSAHPNSFRTWNILGALHLNANQLIDAEKCFRQACKLNAKFADGYGNLANCLKMQNKVNEAKSTYKKALAINPEFPEVLFSLGNIYYNEKKYDEALELYKSASSLNTKESKYYENLATTYLAVGELEEADKAIQIANQLLPNQENILNIKGSILHGQGKFNAAMEEFNNGLSLNPNNSTLLNNLGTSLKHLGRYEEALVITSKSIEIDPSSCEALNNFGSTLCNLDKLPQSIRFFLKAIEVDPEYSPAYTNLADALASSGKPLDALDAYRLAYENDNNNLYSKEKFELQARAVCDWSKKVLETGKTRFDTKENNKVCAPWGQLFSEDDPAKQLERSKAWTQAMYGKIKPLPFIERPKNDKIKIGYFSADFHDFPGMYLMAGMLENHDRNKFEVYAFSYGPNKQDAMRKRIENAVDHFIDIREYSFEDSVKLSRKLNIDIAIHRNGFTNNTRHELFSRGVAPIQINYLGYPGSLGSDCIDYIIADHTVIPREYEKFYSENILFMPDCYQPNDNTRKIAETTTTRKDFGLPEDAIVFCCFNNIYKISEVEFQIWMEILNEVDNSVLWLYKSNDYMVDNLKNEACKSGVDPDRLVFADRLPHADHLARHKHADLFLDTFNYNAHTTASDALWAGLPVVTKIGHQFAARVSASALMALESPELITHSVTEYKALIVELAKNKEKLRSLKGKIAIKKQTAPLFNTQRYTKEFENLLVNVYNKNLDNAT